MSRYKNWLFIGRLHLAVFKSTYWKVGNDWYGWYVWFAYFYITWNYRRMP